MIDYILTGGPYGDATSSYDISIKGNKTMREVLNSIIKDTKIYGYVTIAGERYAYNDYKSAEDLCPDQFLDKVVIGGEASGGWGRMDFVFKLQV